MDDDVIIVGAGIGGLTLGLALHQAGIPCRIFEAAAEIRPLGVGINLLPHATRELGALGLEAELARVAITTTRRPSSTASASSSTRSRSAAPPATTIRNSRSIAATCSGSCSMRSARARARAASSPAGIASASSRTMPASPRIFADGPEGAHRARVRGRVAIACDGIHSAIRKQLYPDEGEPRYSGVNMWRGVTRWKPMLSGASMVRAGWLSHRQDGDLSDPPHRRRRAAARQLGRRDRDAELPQARLEPGGPLDDFIRLRSPTGISTGSTCRP